MARLLTTARALPLPLPRTMDHQSFYGLCAATLAIILMGCV
jgi:hypothetical protein